MCLKEGGNMKKAIMVISLAIIILTACEKDKNNLEMAEQNISPATVSESTKKTSRVETAAEQNTTDSTTAIIERTENTTANKSTTRTKQSEPAAKAQASTGITSVTSSTVNIKTTVSSTKQESYTLESWGITVEDMESEIESYSQNIGMEYKKEYTLESGHWITPTSSLNWDWQSYKNSICNSISYYQSRGYTKVKVIFECAITNLRDGTKSEYMDAYIIVA